jgi:predicted 3-demethylubiquinone-9 3-methyltransferase (glyoxalase superfamily)
VQRIVPHLWFDHEAGEAAEFYTSIFKDSRILNRSTLGDTPSGTIETLTIELSGQEFILLSAGPPFKFTPAISFLVACSTHREVDQIWNRLHEGASDMMPLGAYPFSEKYGWLVDKFGLSWQVMHVGERKGGQKITPTLMFTGEQCGKAEEALSLYTSVLPDSKLGEILRYGAGEEPNAANTVKHAAFSLAGQDFAAMDSALEHGFSFNEAISLMLYCDTQAEIDRYWDALSAHPEAEQCGWLKDGYGLSWQIVPRRLGEMMSSGSPEAIARVTAAFLKMKKFDIAELEKAFASK